ncbi:PadR family transcriptional regulator [Streptomyces massasporeus]|uniref:PadR family transcriptional regulator n=1 Tax=Streptomyces massasporeus TaxID=67324 RepID=UPI00379F141E
MVLGDADKEVLVAQLRRGVLEYCVLALLRNGEQYGVELARRLGSMDALATSEGTLYPLLSRLRRRGLVSTEWRESPMGPPRRYYSLTPEGRNTLAGFSTEWATFRRAVDQLMEGE